MRVNKSNEKKVLNKDLCRPISDL